MITLNVVRRSISLPRQLQAIVSNSLTRTANQGRARLALDRLLTEPRSFSLTISEPTLDWMMIKYSEQAVFNPRREIEHWFAYSAGAYLEPGYMPLFYIRETKDRPSPNKSAVAAIGEGIAGFLAQRLYGCVKLARPSHDYPDIVMESDRTTYLVEAKGTITKSPADAIQENLLRFVSNTATAALLDVRPLKGLIISTEIETEQNYRCEILEVEIVP